MTTTPSIDDQFSAAIYHQDWERVRHMIGEGLVGEDLLEWALTVASTYGQEQVLQDVVARHTPSDDSVTMALSNAVRHAHIDCVKLLCALTPSLHHRQQAMVSFVVAAGQVEVFEHLFPVIPAAWHDLLLIHAASHQKAHLFPQLLYPRQSDVSRALNLAMNNNNLSDIDAIVPIVAPKYLHLCFIYRPFENAPIPSQSILEYVWKKCPNKDELAQRLHSLASAGYLPMPHMPEVIASVQAQEQHDAIAAQVDQSVPSSPPRKM